MLKTIRDRASGFFRSTRVRTVVLLYAGYEAYHFFKNQSILYKTFSAQRHRPGETILDLDLDAVRVVSRESRSLFASAEEMKLQTLISTLQTAKADPRVTGLVVRGLSGLRSIGLAEICELRDAVADFSSGWGGKVAILHVPEGLGSAANGTVPLYFASAFDSVHVQPTSGVIIPGLSLATLFFKRMLDNVGLKAKKVARKEFKTAANNVTEEKFTEPHRESTESLLKAIMDDLVKGISHGRGLSREQVWRAIDTGILSCSEAHELGIVDEPLYRDELPRAMRTRLFEARSKRAEMRKVAEKEWREAMAELKESWTAEDGWLKLWDNGRLIRRVTDFRVAVPRSILFGDEKQEMVKKAVSCEIRALKAHVAWLDTCPWEATIAEDRGDVTVYNAVPQISMLMDTERKVCENAIRALEELPKIVATYREKENDVLTLDKENFQEVVRWCRSMWRAKCMAARMVGTLLDTESNLTDYVTDDGSDLQPEEHIYQPRLFLVGYADEFVNEKDSKSPPVNSKPETQTGSKLPTSPKSPYEPLKLRHVRMSDYLDTVTSEHHAIARFGLPRSSRAAPGSIDQREKQDMFRLQLTGHRIAPWRLRASRGNVVAVVHIDGVISEEKADATRAAIRRADKDPSVKAIVLRLDSPGGSATASDLISRVVEVAQKPVVASMGSVCASGGYFIAAPCDKVFASATTITGSIGVIFQSVNTSGLFEKLGITADSCESGRFARYFGTMATITEWSDEFAARVDAMIDNFYADFVGVVARGRKMDLAEVEHVARGRVWAGSDAVKLGLVDEIGGLKDAVDAAADLAHLAPDADVKAVDYPTMAMQVQDAARRRGLIPANLDEEGDEAIPEKPSRRGFWFGPKDPDDLEQPRNKDHSVLNTGLEDADFEGPRFRQSLLNVVLEYAHVFLVTSSPNCVTASLLEQLLGYTVGFLGHGVQKPVAEELEKIVTIAGRPAAVAPGMYLNDQKR